MATKRRKTARRRKRRSVSGNPSLAPSVISGTRSKRKSTKRRKRRVSSVGKITGSDGGDMLLGTLAGVGLGIGIDLLSKNVTALQGKGKIMSGAKLIGGAVLAIKSKNPLLKGAGLGLSAQGAYTAAHEFGVIKGMDEFIRGVGAGNDDTMLIEMNGVDINSTKLISGTNMYQPSVIGADDDEGMSGDDDFSMSGDDDESMSGQMPSVVF